MSYLTGPRGRWLLAVVIVATALAGCMMPQVAPEPAPQADEEIVTMYVGPVQADCVGEGPQKCLLVKEGSPDGPYLMFYSEIEGFEWEEGYHYELQVRKTKIENPPAGGSSIGYELVQVVNKTPAGEVSTMYVAPMMVECETTEIYKCLLVSDSPDGEYRPFYGKISGFDYEEGYQYSLLVEEVPMDQPPSDAPAGVWNLLAVTQKTPARTVAAPEAQTPLEGTLWQLTSYVDANGQTQTTLAGSEVTATFQDGRVVGSAGCNNYTAEYTLDGSALAIGPAATTLRACISEELSAQEAAYLSALAAVASYEISGETLTLLDAAGQTVLEFAAKTPTSLTGTTWQVTNYNNGKQAVVTLLADTELTMMFDDNGQVSGSAGCNNFTGGYTVDGDAIVIGPLATTMKMCGEPEGVMEQEAAFLAALEAATTFAIQGDEIELRDDSGALQVRATAAAVEPPAASTATPLEGTLWVLTSYMDANGNAVKPIEGSEITLTFEEGRLGGNASCNNYGADYAVDGNTLSIGPVITTMMMCQPEALAQQEHAYLANLARVIAYEIVGDSLALADPEGNDLLTYKASTPTSLTGTTWQVTNYNNGKQAVVTLLSGTEITMTFGEGGLVSGTAGCNTFRGGYTVDGDSIAIGPLATTMMMCVQPEGVMEQEAAFLAALEATTIFTISGDEIELRDDSGALQVRATAQPATPEGASALAGTIWEVVNYNNGQQAVVSLLADTKITMTFDEDGHVSGTAGCNNYSGGYTVDGDTISIGPLVSTMMMCVAPEGVVEQEAAFLAALQAATTFTIGGDSLEMRDAGDALQIVANAQSAAAEATEAEAAIGVPLEGTPWIMTSYISAENQTLEPIEGTEVTAIFMDGRVGGNASCNNYGAAYALDGNSLQIGVAVTTMMLCQPEEVAEQELAYLAALSTVASYQIEGQTLALADADGQVVLTYGVQQQTPLTGTDWQVSLYNNGKEAMVSSLAGTTITLMFVEGGNVTGNGGCNNYTGDYTLDGNQLTIGELATTRMFCAEPEGAMDQETAFLAALQSSTSFQIMGGDLELLDADGARTVTAYAQPAALAAGGNPEDVTGRTWLWENTKYSDQTAAQPEDSTAYTLELLPDGSALVRADCNSLAGSYTMAEDGELTLDLPSEGLSNCGEASLATAYLSDLKKAAVFSLADGALYLELDADAGSIEFVEAGAAVAAPAGEGAAMPAEEATITGQVWAWQSLDMSDGTVTTVENPEQYTIEFLEDGTLNLQADCNTGGGAYTTENGGLTIEAAVLTRMACPPGSLSDEYVARLNEVASYVMDGGLLYLNLKIDSGNMVFAPLAVAEERQPEPTPAPAAEAPAPAATGSAAAIVGPTWQWTGFQDEAERYAISQPSRYSITFQADGKYQIVADCNTGSGTYTVEGKSVSVSPAALTRKACGPDSQDSAFLTNLSAAEMVFVAGNSMYVSTSSGGTMKFTKAK